VVTDPQTHKQTNHRQLRLQYTVPLSLARSVTSNRSVVLSITRLRTVWRDFIERKCGRFSRCRRTCVMPPQTAQKVASRWHLEGRDGDGGMTRTINWTSVSPATGPSAHRRSTTDAPTPGCKLHTRCRRMTNVWIRRRSI